MSRQGDLNAPIICRWCGLELHQRRDRTWVNEVGNAQCGDGPNCLHLATYRGVVVGYNDRAVESWRNPPKEEP